MSTDRKTSVDVGMASGRIVGVDYGTRRVGIAMADPLRLFAQPLGTFDPDTAVERLRSVHRQEGIGTVVIGWPLTEEGGEDKATRRVDLFVRRLRNAIGGVRIVRWDERYTSEEARDRIAGHGRHQKGRLDTAAAGIILQEYLDTLRVRGEGNRSPGTR